VLCTKKNGNFVRLFIAETDRNACCLVSFLWAQCYEQVSMVILTSTECMNDKYHRLIKVTDSKVLYSGECLMSHKSVEGSVLIYNQYFMRKPLKRTWLPVLKSTCHLSILLPQQMVHKRKQYTSCLSLKTQLQITLKNMQKYCAQNFFFLEERNEEGKNNSTYSQKLCTKKRYECMHTFCLNSCRCKKKHHCLLFLVHCTTGG